MGTEPPSPSARTSAHVCPVRGMYVDVQWMSSIASNCNHSFCSRETCYHVDRMKETGSRTTFLLNADIPRSERQFALLVSDEFTIKTNIKDTEEAGLDGESQGQTRLGPSSFCQMELAFPQGRIKQASPAVIQGDISQWGNQTTSRTHGKCGALGQGFQMTPCVVGSMVLLLLLGTLNRVKLTGSSQHRPLLSSL